MKAKEIVRILEAYPDIKQVIDIYSKLEKDDIEAVIDILDKRDIENRKVIEKQKGKDGVGQAATVAATVAGGAAGAATVVATGVGGTILGSTTLASVLGGIFVVSNPVGWIVGAAAATAAAGYGIAKMAKSGGANDKTRENNIAGAKNKEKYDAVRKIDKELFLARDEVMGVLSSYDKIKRVNPLARGASELEIESMFDSTTLNKITVAQRTVYKELNSEISQYLEDNKANIASLKLFLDKCTKYNIISAQKNADIMKKVDDCDILVDEFEEYEANIRESVMLNSQVLLYKLAILADGVVSEAEMGWYYAVLKTKGFDQENAKKLFEECPVHHVNLKDTFAVIEDFFGSSFKTMLVNDIAELLATDDIDRKEYIFLKGLCNQIGETDNYILKQYEENHKFSIMLDKIKSFFK